MKGFTALSSPKAVGIGMDSGRLASVTGAAAAEGSALQRLQNPFAPAFPGI